MASRTQLLFLSLGRRFSQRVKESVLGVQDYVVLTARGLAAIFTPPHYHRELIQQMDSIGVQSLSIVVLTGMFTGMVLALQSAASLDAFGARPYVGRLVAISMVRELGPVLTALMVTGRVASGIAAELGSMTVTDQISALRALGTDPIRKLVIPRVVAGTLMLPVLTVIADAVGMLGAAIITSLQLRVAPTVFWNNVVQGLYVQDIWMGLLKPVVFGFVIVTLACYVGLRTSGGTQGVGRSTTDAVVAGSVAVLAGDFLITKLLIATIY